MKTDQFHQTAVYPPIQTRAITKGDEYPNSSFPRNCSLLKSINLDWFGYFRLFIVAPRRQLVVTGNSARYRTKLLRIQPGSFTCSEYSTVTWDLELTSHLKDN